MLTVASAPVRSRTSQRQAGGAERRASDDGGHYIAARFNGPTEAFNHFAQDANFNRGGYRLREDEWARNKRTGRAVTVKIVPHSAALPFGRRRSTCGGRSTEKKTACNFQTNDRGSAVAETESEQLLNEIGGLLTQDSDYPSEPTLLYAQLDHNMIGQSIFKKLGNQLLYRRPVNERLP